MSSPAQIAATAKPPPRSIPKVRVRRGVLRTTVAFRANVSDTSPIEIGAPLSIGSDDPVITAMAVKRGGSVSEGDLIMAVAGRPVLVLEGKIPAFRDIVFGSRGVDVRQLQAALKHLDLYAGGDRKGVYGKATLNAVKKLYWQTGHRPVGNGIAHGEVVFVPSLPQRVVKVAAHVGDTAKAESPIVTIGSGHVLLRGLVDSVSASALKKGMDGTAISETQGKSFRVRVRSLGAGSNSDKGGGSDQVNVTLIPKGRFDQKLLGENVGVTVTASSTRAKVLIVPIAAVVTRADGTSVVTVVNDRDQTRLVRVKPGLVENGEIAVIPLQHSALSASDWVAVSRSQS
jgi:peptidoglycan hydrolase-like protein with peptidoglycan-binding domain